MPPRPIKAGTLCTTSGNTGPSTRQTPGARPSTCRSTDNAPPLHVAWAQSPTCTSVELGTASGLVLPQPKPGLQFTILATWAWVGCQVEKKVVFSPVVTGGT